MCFLVIFKFTIGFKLFVAHTALDICGEKLPWNTDVEIHYFCHNTPEILKGIRKYKGDIFKIMMKIEPKIISDSMNGSPFKDSIENSEINGEEENCLYPHIKNLFNDYSGKNVENLPGQDENFPFQTENSEISNGDVNFPFQAENNEKDRNDYNDKKGINGKKDTNFPLSTNSSKDENFSNKNSPFLSENIEFIREDENLPFQAENSEKNRNDYSEISGKKDENLPFQS